MPWLESLEPKNPFYKWKGKEEKQIVSFFPTQLVKEGERFWESGKCWYVVEMARESSQMLIFVLLIHMLYEFLSFILMYESSWFGKL